MVVVHVFLFFVFVCWCLFFPLIPAQNILDFESSQRRPRNSSKVPYLTFWGRQSRHLKAPAHKNKLNDKFLKRKEETEMWREEEGEGGSNMKEELPVRCARFISLLSGCLVVLLSGLVVGCLCVGCPG